MYSCDAKDEMSHDASEIIPIFWFCDQFLIDVENSCVA